MIKEELSREQVETILTEIAEVNLSTISIGEMQQILRPILDNLAIETIRYESGFYVYRSRVCDKKPHNIKELTYPSSDLVLKYGRANEIGESMFYGSITKNGSVFETNPEVGREFIISTWRTKHEMALSHMGFTSEVANNLNSERDFTNLYAFIKTSGRKGKLNMSAYNSLALLFAQKVDDHENDKYKLSIAIVKSLLQSSSQGPNGLLYPSFAMFGNTDNIVLKPEFVNANLVFESVEHLVVKKVDGISYAFKQLDTSLELDLEGNILWSGRQLGWNNVPTGSKISKKFGENAQMIDPKGDIIKRTYADPVKEVVSELKDSFDSDHQHLKSFKFSFDYEDTPTKVKVQSQVYIDLNGSQKFLAFYIPSTPNVINIVIYCIEWHKEFLAKMDDENIPFNNFIYFYTEDRILKSQDVKDKYSELMFGFCSTSES